MFERFTDRARRIVVLAQEEARMRNYHFIGTEHLLLGMVHEREGVAAKALERLGITDLETVRATALQVSDYKPEAFSMTGHIPFTPRAKQVLELSLREALQLGHNYIGTEHILLGLVREGQGVGAKMLMALLAPSPSPLVDVRQTVISLLSAYGPVKPTKAEPSSSNVVISLDPAQAKEILDVLDGLHVALFRSDWGTHPLNALHRMLENGLRKVAAQESSVPEAG